MHEGGFFFQAFVYLTAAVIAVPFAKRLGLGSVLGYLIAGIVIGPFGLELIGEEGQDVMHFAEFGVVMMLFLVGLELQPRLLWRLRASILGLGGLQVSVTAAILMGLGLWVGLVWQMALAIGLTLALSSTAIVLQTLDEKDLTKTVAGQSAFSVLLFQDIAVIPMLAVFPLLATLPGGGEAAHAATWVDDLPGWGQTLLVVGAVAGVVVAGLFLVRPVFRLIAATRLRELFTAASLLLVIGIAILMAKVGLSPALGTFLAGVVLANSEYRHALESDIEPFKGLLLGLFFIAVGASVDFQLIADSPGTIGALVAGLIAVKMVLLFALGGGFRLGTDQSLLFAFALAQGGEFAFVLFAHATQTGVLDETIVGPLIAAVAVTMALTPLLMLFGERVVLPRIGTRQQEGRAPDDIHEQNPVIIAGFGRFGSILGRLLRSQGVGATVLDNDSNHVDLLRKYGFEVFYGDATRLDLLTAAGAARAKLMVVAIDEPERILELVGTVKKNFPNLTILARANGRTHAYELLDAGVDHIYRETFDTSLRAGTDALRLLGLPGYAANRRARTFRRHDERYMREQSVLRHDGKAYFRHVRAQLDEMERLMSADDQAEKEIRDAAWDVAPVRHEIAARGDSLGGTPATGDDAS